MVIYYDVRLGSPRTIHFVTSMTFHKQRNWPPFILLYLGWLLMFPLSAVLIVLNSNSNSLLCAGASSIKKNVFLGILLQLSTSYKLKIKSSEN